MANNQRKSYEDSSVSLPIGSEHVGSGTDGLIWRGECLSACAALQKRGIKPDTIYIDPPFASSDNYFKPLYLRPPLGTVLPNSTKLVPALQATVFRDSLAPEVFLAWLEPQIVALHEVLSETGSLFLHLDHHISHYARVLLDRIFGRDNFRNEIIWSYRTGGVSKRTFAKKHDTIFFYSKSSKYSFYPQYYRSYQARRYNYNAKYPEIWDDKAQRWYHLAVCRDVWDDINVIGTEREGSERLDYPTQKPEALLERIIAATTTESQTVADFFGGSGVCAAVAHRLGRRFIHSDVSPISIAICRQRLLTQGASFKVEELEPPSAESDTAKGIMWSSSWIQNGAESQEYGQMELDFSSPTEPAHVLIHQYHNVALEQSLGLDLPTGLETVEWISADCTASKGPWHSDAEVYIDPFGRSWQDKQEQPWRGSLLCPRLPQRLRIRDISGRDTMGELKYHWD